MLRSAAVAQEITTRVPAGSKLLEIGPGEGHLSRLLWTMGYHVTAVDLEQRSTLPTIVTDFQAWEAKDMRFACIVASLVLHHLPNLQAILRKMHRLLEPQGVVVIDDYGWERLEANQARAQWSDTWEAEMRVWRAERKHLHRSDVMLETLRSHFEEVAYRDHAYFADGLGSDAMAFTFIGRRKTDRT